MDHALEFDDDLAHALTVLQRRQSLCRVRERKAHGNVRTDRAAGMEGDYFIEIGLALFRFAAGEVAIEDADDLAALEQGKVERPAGYPGGEIGSASGRERVCQNVEIAVGAV